MVADPKGASRKLPQVDMGKKVLGPAVVPPEKFIPEWPRGPQKPPLTWPGGAPSRNDDAAKMKWSNRA